MAGVPAQVQATVKERGGRPAAVVTGRPGGPWNGAETRPLGRCPTGGPVDTTPGPLRSGHPATAMPPVPAAHSRTASWPPRLDLVSGQSEMQRGGPAISPRSPGAPAGGEVPRAEAGLV